MKMACYIRILTQPPMYVAPPTVSILMMMQFMFALNAPHESWRCSSQDSRCVDFVLCPRSKNAANSITVLVVAPKYPRVYFEAAPGDDFVCSLLCSCAEFHELFMAR
jgi:hypothetical protein